MNQGFFVMIQCYDIDISYHCGELMQCLCRSIKLILKALPYAFLVFVLTHSTPSWAYYSPYSTQELDELEKEFIEQINQSNLVIRTPLARLYINHLGHLLTRHAAEGVNPDFFIVKSNTINAFAGPGGHIGINSQLILATENESELAAVMAHEISHVKLHHLYRMIQRQKQMKIPMLASVLASAALGLINPALGNGALMATLSGFAQDNINFTRANEKEADRIGINMLIRAGFNPEGMIDFFKKMQKNTRYYYDNIPEILRTHPLDQDRIAEAQNRAQGYQNRPKTLHSNYFLFKELIRIQASQDDKRLLDYYQYQCKKVAPEFACQYGKALEYLQLAQYERAINLLLPLTQKKPDNLYYQLALADAEIASKKAPEAIRRLKKLNDDTPENYAVMLSLGQILLQSGEPEKASMVFLKASRLHPKDLTTCMELARSQSHAGKKAFAYFSYAQCELLQGHHKKARRLLKNAKQLVKNNRYLKARIEAKQEEIKLE